jgi:hypothetical protein
MSSVPLRDALDDKVNRTFAGKVVRKDLVRKVKVGANVPVFVLEFPRSDRRRRRACRPDILWRSEDSSFQGFRFKLNFRSRVVVDPKKRLGWTCS